MQNGDTRYLRVAASQRGYETVPLRLPCARDAQGGLGRCLSQCLDEQRREVARFCNPHRRGGDAPLAVPVREHDYSVGLVPSHPEVLVGTQRLREEDPPPPTLSKRWLRHDPMMRAAPFAVKRRTSGGGPIGRDLRAGGRDGRPVVRARTPPGRPKLSDLR